MARLPIPGGDDGNWGDVLNEYLAQSLKPNGAIKDNAITSNTIAPGAITNAAIASDAISTASIIDGTITNALIANSTIEEAKLSSAVQTKLNSSGGTPDWNTITNKPAVIAAGADQAAARSAIGAGTSNLGLGTSSSTAKAGDYQPTAANISDSTAIGRALVTAANAAAAKTTLSLAKADVGLGNVDNTSDASKNSAAATLTNKTISGSDNTVSNIGIGSLSTTGSASNTTYLRGDGAWTSPPAGGDTSTNTTSAVDSELALFAGTSGKSLKRATGTGVPKLTAGVLSIATPGTDYSTASATETLTNKTLVDPKLNGSILDADGHTLIRSNAWSSSAVNYLGVETSPLGSQYVQLNANGDDTNIHLSLKPSGTGEVQIFKDSGNVATLVGNGTNTDIDLNLRSKGAGKVKANNIDVATVSDTQTLTNKTISGSANTLTDIPAAAITGLDDYSRLVCTTVNGGTGAEDGTNTWAKIATFSTATNEFAEAQLLLSVTSANSGNHDTATVSVYFRSNSTNSNPTADVKILSKGGNGFIIANDSFKVISGGWSTDLELWVRKGAPYGRLSFYETSKNLAGGTLTYTTAPSWQAATPIGAVNNISSNGVYSGMPLTVNGHISTNGINDTNGNPLVDLGTIPNAVNRVYIDNQSAGNYPTIGAVGPDTDIGIAIAPKNNGPVNLFGNAPTIAAAGGANGGNLSLNLKSQGTGVVKANGTPVATSKMMYPQYVESSRFEPWPQIMCAGGNWSLATGDLPLTLFIPGVDMTVNNIITMGWHDTTQAGATACRVAIYRVDDIYADNPADRFTCIARSGHKADRWNGAVLDTAPIVDNGAASPSPISSVTLTAGQQYAVGFMSVGHTGTVKLSALGVFRKNTLTPHIGYFGDGGYSDMPEHIVGGWLEEWTYIWFALT